MSPGSLAGAAGNTRERLYLLGLVGGVASGKSLVAETLRSLGAELLDGDRAGHEVLRETEVREEVRRRWGDAVFSPDGEVNRAALARRVFEPTPAGRAELAHLEQITHPRIRTRLEQQAAELLSRGVRVAVLDAPVMIKAGWHKLCDAIWYIDAPHDQREARAAARGWSADEFARREAAQESLDFKRRLSQAVIDNSGSAEATRAQVKQLWRAMGEK